MAEKKIRVCIYEDNNALRDSLVQLVMFDKGMEMVGAFPNPTKILDNMKEFKPDVVIMDIQMPGMSGIEAVALVKKNFPDIKVIMQTVFDDDNKVFHSICAGAVGYMLKKSTPDQIIEAVKQAAEGGAPMTPVIASKMLHLFREQNNTPVNEKVDMSTREKDILTFLTRGLSYKMIAAECNISIDTVRFHIKNLYEKLHVHSMTEAVARALREKLI